MTSLTQMSFSQTLTDHNLGELRAESSITLLQVNVGKLCNQACKHCHVEAGPNRTEIMTLETVDQVLDVLRRNRISTIDITGGAPELNPNFYYLVSEARKAGAHVIVRHNLTVQFIPGHETLPQFFKENSVEVVASLPYFLSEQTDAQRGKGVFDESILAMRKLNDAGYGKEDSGLILNLVFNPTGAFLPPDQLSMEADFKKELKSRYDLDFNSLFTITNMPIRRFLDFLVRSGNYDKYMDKLVNSFNSKAVNGLKCRTLVNVGWDGKLYDCDFNQMLDLTVGDGLPQHISKLDITALGERQIVTGNHCFGCTAGNGSSCGGAVTK